MTKHKPYGNKELVNKLPKTIVLFSKRYRMQYCENPVDVDSQKRQSLWGEVDHWDNTMRIFIGNGVRDFTEVMHTIVHECVHAIEAQLKLDENCCNEHFIDLLSLGIVDLLKNNKIFSYLYIGRYDDTKN